MHLQPSHAIGRLALGAMILRLSGADSDSHRDRCIPTIRPGAALPLPPVRMDTSKEADTGKLVRSMRARGNAGRQRGAIDYVLLWMPGGNAMESGEVIRGTLLRSVFGGWLGAHHVHHVYHLRAYQPHMRR